jgi:hypothetical protein
MVTIAASGFLAKARPGAYLPASFNQRSARP